MASTFQRRRTKEYLPLFQIEVNKMRHVSGLFFANCWLAIIARRSGEAVNCEKQYRKRWANTAGSYEDLHRFTQEICVRHAY